MSDEWWMAIVGGTSVVILIGLFMTGHDYGRMKACQQVFNVLNVTRPDAYAVLKTAKVCE